MTEEEVVVRNLTNELSSMKSYLSIASAKCQNLQYRMDEGRIRYEQRLSMLSSHAMPKESSESSINIANKVEILRLPQELSEAVKSLSASQDGPIEENNQLALEMSKMKSEEPLQNEQLMTTINGLREKNKKVEELSSFKEYVNKIGESGEERSVWQRKVHCLEEEEEGERRGKDVDRLRRDRNDWRDYYDEAVAWNEEEEYEYADPEHPRLKNFN